MTIPNYHPSYGEEHCTMDHSHFISVGYATSNASGSMVGCSIATSLSKLNRSEALCRQNNYAGRCTVISNWYRAVSMDKKALRSSFHRMLTNVIGSKRSFSRKSDQEFSPLEFCSSCVRRGSSKWLARISYTQLLLPSQKYSALSPCMRRALLH